MAGLYPDNKEIVCFGKKVVFPGVDKDGKFTNGNFSDPDVPPSFLDADTIDLIIDNLNSLIEYLGNTPNNKDGDQLKKLFAVAAEANKAVKRDAAGRAKVAAPSEADDIARKKEVDDAEAAVLKALASHANNTSNPHKVTKTQVGLENVPNVKTNDQTPTFTEAAERANIESGEKITTIFGKIKKALTDIFAHISDTSNPHKVTKTQVGLENVDNTADSQKRVSYAESAGSVTWDNVSSKPTFASVATSGKYDDLTEKPTIPSLDGYATVDWVKEQGYKTSDAVSSVNGNTGAVTIDVPTRTSQLTNDSGFLTSHQSLDGYATEGWVKGNFPQGIICNSYTEVYNTIKLGENVSFITLNGAINQMQFDVLSRDAIGIYFWYFEISTGKPQSHYLSDIGEGIYPIIIFKKS